MGEIIESTNWIGTNYFEVVEKIPKGFFVWNIGDNMIDGYIPLCEYLNPSDKEDYSINPLTLKAIKMEENEIRILRQAAHRGVNSLETAKKNYCDEQGKILSIFEKISE